MARNARPAACVLHTDASHLRRDSDEATASATKPGDHSLAAPSGEVVEHRASPGEQSYFVVAVAHVTVEGDRDGRRETEGLTYCKRDNATYTDMML